MKPVIPNYEILETLGESLQAVVYKAFHKRNPQRLLALKVLKVASLTDEQKRYFRQKIEQLKVLHDPLVITPLSFEAKGDVRFITQDYFKGVSLDAWAKAQKKVSLKDFFRIACKLAQGLDDVHKAGIVHGGVKPHNILIEPDTLDIRLIDFMTPLDVRDVSHFIYDRSFVEGTLAYTSPEQTGRINHRVDFSTDLYSVGIVFYELLTGRLPFFSTDPLELIHSHLAEEAPGMHELNPEIPSVMGKIVSRLTLKQPEKRYQSGVGLLVDLTRCRDEWLSTGTAGEFPLGSRDRRHRVVFVSKMVGRDREAGIILKEYERAVEGSFRCLLISGLPGIGKTRLIQELQKPIVEHRGYFTSGKFDVYQKNIPYSSLIQALRNLMRTFLTESDERVATWKKRIMDAVGDHGKVITEVIPELAILIGPQPEVRPLPPVESRNRFHDLFGRFLTCLAGEKHPLTVFIDDLQWCDAASFDFLSNVFANYKEHPYLFLLGAYRHNEVDSSHPLAKLIRSIKEDGQPLEETRLGPLEPRYCHEMVSYILDSPLSQTQDLSEFIARLTEGNPLFVSESLSYLHNEELLYLDENRCWQWDLDKIRRTDMPSTVVGLFSSKVRSLPPDAVTLLEYCACMGNRFAPDEVSLVRDIRLLDLFETLKPALGEGLLMESKDQLQFVHDRVQEAVLSGIKPERRRLIHWEIGNHLLSVVPENADLEKLDNLFAIAAHLNLGRKETLKRKTAYRLSDINFHAGNKALDSLAAEAANEYFRHSLELLPEDCWDTQYDRTFKIFQELAKTELMCGRYEHSEKLLNQLLEHAKTDLDKAEALAEQTTSLSSIGNFIKAIETANRGLAFFGKSIPEDPELAEKKREELMNEIKAKHVDVWNTILNMPFTEERKSKIELAFYSELIPDLYMSGLVPQLYLSAVQSTQHCLAGGMDESVIYSFSIMGLYLGEQGEFEQAFRYEDLARDLSAKNPNTFGATRGMNGIVWCNMHSRSHPEEIANYCLKAIQCGKNCGDLYNAGLSYGPLMWNLQVRGADLSAIEEYAEECFEFSKKYRLLFSAGLAEVMKAGWIAPMKKGYTPAPMEDKLRQWEKENHIALAGSFYVHMAVSHHYFGEYEKADEYLRGVNRYLTGLTDNVLKRQWYVFRVLNALRLYEMGAYPGDQNQLLAEIQPLIKKVETWARLGPLLKPYLLFLYADMERVLGCSREARNLFLDAVELAHQYGYTLLEGHLHECLGEMIATEPAIGEACPEYETCNRKKRSCDRWWFCTKISAAIARGSSRYDSVAGVFVREAARLYRECHAERKEMALMENYPECFEEEVPAAMPVEAVPAATYTLPSLDVDYLMKSSLAISAEVNPDALLNKIMNVVLEASGAQNGYLLMDEDGQLFVCAESHITDRNVVRTGKHEINDVPGVPKAIVRYVHRTRMRVILNNASGEGEFKDNPEVRDMALKSVLCLPLIKQSRLIGILYLENHLSDAVFTPEKTEMTELLTSQAAISLENARLLDEMKQAENQIKASLNEKELLLKEIHHRVKNNLQVISSLLNLQLAQVKDKQAKEMFREGRDRIRSMAFIHEGLYRSERLSDVDFAGYVRSLTGSLFRSYGISSNAVSLKINAGKSVLGIDTAVPCGLIINELVSNSLKHAFPKGRKGEIFIDLHWQGGNRFVLVVGDNGVGFPEDVDFRNTESLGLQLVCTLTNQMDGTIELDRRGGTKLTIAFTDINGMKP